MMIRSALRVGQGICGDFEVVARDLLGGDWDADQDGFADRATRDLSSLGDRGARLAGVVSGCSASGVDLNAGCAETRKSLDRIYRIKQNWGSRADKFEHSQKFCLIL